MLEHYYATWSSHSVGLLPFDKERILPEDAKDNEYPDEDWQKATGATMERWYRRAALMVWP